MNKKQLFLTRALQVYMHHGIKAISMDEMAKQLGISKKTIYTFVKNKAELVEESILQEQVFRAKEVLLISEQNLHPIQELLMIAEKVVEQLQNIHPMLFRDLQKYHPFVYQKLGESRSRLIYERVVENLKKGKQHELFREEIDEALVAKMYLSFIQTLFKNEDSSIKEKGHVYVYQEFMRYHLHAITSAKGRRYLARKKGIFHD